MTIIISHRSGLVTGIMELVILLVCSPIATRATSRIFNHMTTRRVLSGKPVKIRDTSMSLEDLIPRTFLMCYAAKKKAAQNRSISRPDFARQLITLSISILLTSGILLLGIFTDGTTVPVYKQTTLYVWNSGKFVDTTETGQNGRADDVVGMAAVRSACVERKSASDFNLYAVAFMEKQNFEGGSVANNSVCLNGVDTKEKRGIILSTNSIFNPPAEPVHKESMGGQRAEFQFLQDIERLGAGTFCRVSVTTGNTTEEWTFSEAEFYTKTRFAARAVRTGKNSVTLNVGVAYHDVDDMDPYLKEVVDDECSSLKPTMFTGNRFEARITEMGIRQDLRKLELVVADTLLEHVLSGYGKLESQDVMLRAYYAGRSDSAEAQGQALGTFDRQVVNVLDGNDHVTELHGPAVVGLVMTAFGTLILVLVSGCIQPVVRMTSPRYISALYRSTRKKRGGELERTKQGDYIGVSVLDNEVCVVPIVAEDISEQTFVDDVN